MKQSEKIKTALGLATALFVSVPGVSQAVDVGRRLSGSGKRATGVRSDKRDDPRDYSTKRVKPETSKDIRALRRDTSAKAKRDNPFGGKTKRDNPIGGMPRRGNPIGDKIRRDNPTGGVRRRDDPRGKPTDGVRRLDKANKKIQDKDAGLIMK